MQKQNSSRIKDVFKLLEKNDFVECVKSGKRLWNRGIISAGAKNLLYLLVPEAKWLQDPMSGFFIGIFSFLFGSYSVFAFIIFFTFLKSTLANLKPKKPDIGS